MLTAVEGLAAWKSVRQIAREIHGVDAEAVKDWDSDGNVRAQMRRLVKKARFLMQRGIWSWRPGGGRGCEYWAGRLAFPESWGPVKEVSRDRADSG